MKNRFKIGQVLCSKIESFARYNIRFQIIDISNTYILRILNIENHSIFRVGDEMKASDFEFIEDNYVLDQEYINEQKIKKLLGLDTN